MKILYTFCFLFFALTINAQQTINGIWASGKENTKIEILNTTGKIHSSANEKATVGKLIIKELKNIDNTYKGKLFIIKKNKWVDAVFVSNKNILTVTISAGFQKKTIVWQLIK
ncbi:MAG: hypothetical protein ACKVOM_10290 [Ferruginibacter sp.]